MGSTHGNRPLAELGPMEQRRNSSSSSQPDTNADSSPFDPSPYDPATGASPRLFWQGRDSVSPSRVGSENPSYGVRDNSPSPNKRSSIENLKRASRVRNSNMFALELQQEYDPTSLPDIQRPMASGRPLSKQSPANAFATRGLNSPRTEAVPRGLNFKPMEQSGKFPHLSPDKSTLTSPISNTYTTSPSKGRASPIKSSLSNPTSTVRQTGTQDSDVDVVSDDEPATERQLPPGRVLHRHAKSVTFDARPPQINEYEMTTPELSSVGTGSRDSSYDSAVEDAESDEYSRDDSTEREDSFEPRLQGSEDSPAIDMGDWRHMSPAASSTLPGAHLEDPFVSENNSPFPHARLESKEASRPARLRTDSNASLGDHRPLPPLPGVDTGCTQPTSSPDLLGLAKRRDSVHRALPSPPAPSSVSKSEILNMKGSSMTLEDRLSLMMGHEGNSHSRENSVQPGPREHEKTPNTEPELEVQSHHNQDGNQEKTAAPAVEYQPPPRISRESILRKVKNQNQLHEENPFMFSSPSPTSTPERSLAAYLDPDVPLPSTESPATEEYTETSEMIKQEHDDEISFDSIPELPTAQSQMFLPAESFPGPQQNTQVDDDGSNYSRDSLGNEIAEQQANEDEASTPKGTPPFSAMRDSDQVGGNRMSLPEFSSLLGEEMDFGLQSYIVSEPSKADKKAEAEGTQPTCAAAISQRPETPEEQLIPPRFPGYGAGSEEELKTPESVIRHPVRENDSTPDSPGVPERVATIKAPGGKLRARPSATPADLAAMSAARRQVSAEVASPPPVPKVPERHRDRPSLVPNQAGETAVEMSDSQLLTENGHDVLSTTDGNSNRRKSLVKLDVPMSSLTDDLSIGLDKEFDRVLESQKVAFDLSLSSLSYHRPLNSISDNPEDPPSLLLNEFSDRTFRRQRGYLMRQNTKVIIASSNADESASSNVQLPPPSARGTRSAGNSPRKPSHERPQALNIESWNGSKIRRKSIRDGSSSPKKKPVEGSAPPIPGKESNVTGVPSGTTQTETTPEEHEPGAERGRLFVKVIGVKDLDLPLPRGQQSWFNLTLDNGIHCVQTSWLELGKKAPIGQEFELVVLDDLEFTLTLQTEAPQPPAQPTPESPTKSAKMPKPSPFSRVFASPKKRKELEKRQEEDLRAARLKQEAAAKRLTAQPTAWDLQNGLVARDGTFARAYVSLKEHESRAYGRPYNIDTDCFNEWATEQVNSGSSVKSKRGEVQRRPPYKIGKLELQLLFVPKPPGASDAYVPKSLNACIRELKEAEANASRKWEGHLSQQGGDCPYWRRRFFKLDGSKLTAYHETTRQPRATINLAKATKLIDDRSSLTKKEVSSRGGRRKSAFAEEEEGYMFVEEGFRIRFGNGEIIDFYADSAAAKEECMKVLGDMVGKDTSGNKTWTDLVLGRERAASERKMKLPPSLVAGSSARHSMNILGQPAPPTPAERDARRQPPAGRRANPVPKSMIF